MVRIIVNELCNGISSISSNNILQSLLYVARYLFITPSFFHTQTVGDAQNPKKFTK